MNSKSGLIVGLICARGGSKGVPRKNIRLLAGKPLIAYSIETALASKRIDRLIVSTEDDEIAKIARDYGAEVPFKRPSELAGDDSPEWLTWQHAVRTLQANERKNINAIVSLSPTAPLRAVKDIDTAIEEFLISDADLVISVSAAHNNPYFNMVILDKTGYARLVIEAKKNIFRRQDAPQIYAMTTAVYVARPSFVLDSKSIFEGKVRAVHVPPERAVDIDTELDFKFAEFLMAQKQKENQK